MRLWWHAVFNRISRLCEGRAAVCQGLFILFLTIVSTSFTMQGWKSRIPAFDLITYHYGIRNFLQTGTVLQHGDTGSYGSYKPAGTAWLMLPGAVLFPDPRLSDYPGAALLHLSTLAGLYLLARRYFGARCAILASILYAFSAYGLFLAGSLWPNGRPDFFIWVVYFSSEWIRRRDARYLGAALTVWGCGMYVDMAILPVLFIIPVLWLYYRPPLRLVPMLSSAVMILLVWSPYLRFEAPRSFADIRSQLLQQPIHAANDRKTWCNPGLSLQTWEADSGTSQSTLETVQAPLSPTGNAFTQLSSLGGRLAEALLSNFQAAGSTQWAAVILLLFTLGGVLLSTATGESSSSNGRLIQPGLWRNRAFLIGGGMILCGLLISGLILVTSLFGISHVLHGATLSLLVKLQRISIFSGLVLIAGSWILRITNRLLSRFHLDFDTPRPSRETRVLVLSLLIPWFLLVLFAEPGKPERFMWLWPIQSMFLAAFLLNMLPALHVDRRLITVGVVAILVLVVGNSFLLDRLDSWMKTGWAGADAPEVQVVDAISDDMHAKGRDEAAVGYQTFIYAFMAEYNVTNPLYKVGAEFDLLFHFRRGISNLNQCAEGVSAQDEYRVIEVTPKNVEGGPTEYFPRDDNDQFHLLGQYGTYQVYERDLPQY